MKIDELLERWQNGTITQDELRDLTALLSEQGHRTALLDDWLIEGSLPGVLSGAAIAELHEAAVAQAKAIPSPPRSCWVSWRQWRPLAAAAVIALLAGGLGVATYVRSGVEVLRVSADVVPALQAGSRMWSKDLKLVRGEVRLRLNSGVTLDVAGPADLRFIDDMHLWLNAGRVTAEVGDEGKGFVIETPQSRVLDLGTRFEVNVADAAHTDVDVLQGRVELFENTGRESATLLKAGDMVRMNGAGRMLRFRTAQPEWTLGPFGRPPDALPVLGPDDEPVFNCPMRKAPVRWEAKATFNPAAVVKDGKVYLLYRAMEAKSGEGRVTSRIGLAVSDDGFNFTRMPEPVLFPDEDGQQPYEWIGGCEDPRVVETEDGAYVMFYTQFAPPAGPKGTRLATATSRDLLHWTKHGPVFAQQGAGQPIMPSKAASMVCKVVNGRLIAAKIHGRYWVYVGRGTIHLMSSPDLVHWDLLPGKILESTTARADKFDSGEVEAGPPALLTDLGIVLLYNGKNGDTALTDIDITARATSCGQALFSASDPAKLLDRTDTPFLKPELIWERRFLNRTDSIYGEGLVLFQGRWFLYYGGADTFVGVATAKARHHQ